MPRDKRKYAAEVSWDDVLTQVEQMEETCHCFVILVLHGRGGPQERPYMTVTFSEHRTDLLEGTLWHSRHELPAKRGKNLYGVILHGLSQALYEYLRQPWRWSMAHRRSVSDVDG